MAEAAPGVVVVDAEITQGTFWLIPRVADPGCLSRIRLFSSPDPNLSIPDPNFSTPDPHQRI
jgi:hypothetical protein